MHFFPLQLPRANHMTCKLPSLVPRAHVSFGQHQGTELWSNRSSGFTAHACLAVYMVSRDTVDVDAFHKGIQYALEKLEGRNLTLKKQLYQILKAKDTWAPGTSLLIIPELRVLVLTKRHVGSGYEIANCLQLMVNLLMRSSV